MKRPLLIASLCLLGCGNPTRPPPANPTPEVPKAAAPTPPVKEGPVEVKMSVLAMTAADPDPHVIVNGEALKSGDKVALTVKVIDQPAYVYIAQTSSDGTATRIYPDSGDVQVSPDNPIHIPQEGRWFKLDQRVGQENFFVYAAKQAIPPATLDARMKSDAATVKTAAQVKKPVTRPKPKVGDPGPGRLRRGLEIEENDPDHPSGSDGIVGRRFTIQHRK